MSSAPEPTQRKPIMAKPKPMRRAATWAASAANAIRFRCAVVRTYRAYRTQVPEQRAVALTLARGQPTQPSHGPLCASSIRQWHRRVTHQGWGPCARSPRARTRGGRRCPPRWNC